jgi:uncharacterized surface protein with fasciclin (FAS1) repeats
MKLPLIRMAASAALMVSTLTLGAGSALADNPVVGGAPMFASKNIIENAVNSKDHTTLVAAVKAAGLVETLQGPGPFTVFAPTNAAFEELPDGTVPTLLKAENKETLTTVLTCHVVGADAMSSMVKAMIADEGGSHVIETLGGCNLIATVQNGNLLIKDENGNIATVTIADVDQSNGVIHVIDKVLLPKA